MEKKIIKIEFVNFTLKKISMIKTVLIIIISVSIFGLILFVLVKNAMKKKIDELVKNKKKLK